MKAFGNRATFAIEVGGACDASDHTRLDFYTHGIHLNRLDNAGYVGACLHYWPVWDAEECKNAGSIYAEVPLSASPEALLAHIMADGDLWGRHLTFSLGPVTDSFGVLAFIRATDVVLIFTRNDGWGDDPSDLPFWNVSDQVGWWQGEDMPDSSPILHWLSVTLPKEEFIHICASAHQALLAVQPNKSR